MAGNLYRVGTQVEQPANPFYGLCQSEIVIDLKMNQDSPLALIAEYRKESRRTADLYRSVVRTVGNHFHSSNGPVPQERDQQVPIVR
jgi:hypothetical protein